MSSFLRYILILLVCLTGSTAKAGWNDMPTGLTDDLNDVYFWGANGVMAGEHGIYYTTTSGSSWTRFTFTGSATNLAIYNATHFYALASSNANEAYFCGQDTVNQNARIFKFNVSTLTYSIVYTGPAFSSLRAITFNPGGSRLYAVGDDGLVVRSNLTTYTVVNLGTIADLTAIDTYYSNIVIAGNGVIINCTDSGTLLGTLFTHTGANFRDIRLLSSSIAYGVGVIGYKFSTSFSSYSTMTDYDPSPLNAADICGSGSFMYLATDHGIYRGDFSFNYAEHMISSGNSSFSRIWFPASSTTAGYAVGKGGKLMNTTDAGGAVKPYAALYLTVNCRGSYSNLQGINGSATNCRWYLNGGLFATSCGSIAHNFTTAGTYTLTYIIWNSDGIYDTASQVINIVDPPLVNMPTTLSDSLLCRKEPVLIGIAATQTGFNYQLKRYGSPLTFGSVPGTGAAVSLLSDSLTQDVNYYVNVQSNVSQCAKPFSDTLKIYVENTKADLRCSYVNTAVGEGAAFYELCKDATNFSWQFPADASPMFSSAANPNPVTFSTTGSKDVKLVCWSDNGCYDSITKTATTLVYTEPAPDDTCWAQAIDGLDPPYVSNFHAGLSDAVPANNGYLLCGRTNYDIYTSRYANAVGRTNSHGGCLLKYSPNGVLKWIVSNKDVNYVSGGAYVEPIINSAYSDENGDIFIAGDAYAAQSWLYTNEGDSVKPAVPANPTYASAETGYIAKLDSMGALKWRVAFLSSVPEHIRTDHSGNIYITGYFHYYYSYLDNGTDSTLVPNCTGLHHFLMKLDPSGNLLWNAKIDLSNANVSTISGFDIDDNNNIYLAGTTEYTSYFHSAHSSAVLVSNPPPSGAGGPFYGNRMFAVKYDSTGTPLWTVRAYTPSALMFEEATASSIVCDNAGNSYIAGTTSVNANGPGLNHFEITDAGGTVTAPSVGNWYLLKLDPAGSLDWVTGQLPDLNAYGTIAPKLAKWNDTISLVGSTYNQPWNTWTGHLGSTDGDSISTGNTGKDLYIADYTSNGVLLRVMKTGNTNVYSGSTPTAMFRDKTGQYYIMGQASMNTTAPSFNFFSDVITPNGYWESFIGKMGLYPCVPNLVTTVDNTSSPEAEITVYPNPVHNELNILLHDNAESTIRLYNAMGQLVFESEYHSQSIRISCSDFVNAAGLYFLEARTADGLFYAKFVVE